MCKGEVLSSPSRGAWSTGARCGPEVRQLGERRANHGQLQSTLDEVFARHSAEEWLTRLHAAGVPCGPANSLAEALRDPQTIARNMIVTTKHPYFGMVEQVASPVRVGAQPPTYTRAPRRNHNADEVLNDLLGYDDDAVRDLATAGAFGRHESIK